MIRLTRDPMTNPKTNLMTNPMIDCMTDPMTNAMTYPMTDPVTNPMIEFMTDPMLDPMADLMINIVADPMTDKIVFLGQFCTLAMFSYLCIFLATLLALHFTPVSESASDSFGLA